MKKISLLVPSLFGVALMGLGCNPFASIQQKIENKIGETVTEKVLEDATGGQVDINADGENNAVTFRDAKTGDYSAWGENAKIPDGFPSDMPQYPGAKTIMVSLKGDKTEAGLSQTTSDPFTKVSDWLSGQMKSAGYAEASTFEAGSSGKMVSYEKDDVTIGVTLGADDEGKETTIILTRNVK